MNEQSSALALWVVGRTDFAVPANSRGVNTSSAADSKLVP